MLTRRATGLPAVVARAPLRTVRPRDVGVYTQPRVQMLRLERQGLLHRMADGYFAVVPQDRVGIGWTPTLEGAAAGIAAADFGEGSYALMGISAARLHGAIPRAVGVAVVAAPRRRQRLRLTDRAAQVRFLIRDIDRVRVERVVTDMGACLVTTPEQTVLDLAHLPRLGDVETEVWNAVDILVPRCDADTLEHIAGEQRLKAALYRIHRRVRP